MSEVEFASKAGYVSLIVDGKDITKISKSVAIRAGVGDINTVSVEIIGAGLDVTMAADVSLRLTPEPGYVVIEEKQPNGDTRWRTERT